MAYRHASSPSLYVLFVTFYFFFLSFLSLSWRSSIFMSVTDGRVCLSIFTDYREEYEDWMQVPRRVRWEPHSTLSNFIVHAMSIFLNISPFFLSLSPLSNNNRFVWAENVLEGYAIFPRGESWKLSYFVSQQRMENLIFNDSIMSNVCFSYHGKDFLSLSLSLCLFPLITVWKENATCHQVLFITNPNVNDNGQSYVRCKANGDRLLRRLFFILFSQ